jgi:predicted membrane channel-forming protein YqfA (hemolysin III family)
MTLISYKYIRKDLQTNKYITYGYRKTMNLYNCILSIFQIHNESGNIWTQIIPFIYFCYNLNIDLIYINQIYILYVLSIIIGYFCSIIAHICSPISKNVKLCLFKIDHITITINACMIGIINNILYYDICQLLLILIICILQIYIIWSSKFIKLYKINQIIILILINYSVIINGFYIPFILYGIGGIIYIIKFPEYLFISKFNIIGHSQQLMHIIYFIAHMIHYNYINKFI